MSAKILVADDSATIQKVVKITLADEPFELLEALDEVALFTALRAGDVSVVLLDFNLSEDKSGYQLAEEISQKYPKTAVMAMLGTFDSVDANQLAKSGVKDKIVKPFDSQKFVDKCHTLLEAVEMDDPQGIIESIEQVEEVEEDAVEFEAPPAEEEVVQEVNEEDEILEAQEDAGEDWSVESSAPLDEEEKSVPVEQMLEEAKGNKLQEAASDWAGEVPGVIGEESEGLKPPVIEGANELQEGSDVMDEIHEEHLAADQDQEEEEESNFDLDATSTFRLEDIEEQEVQKTPDEEDLEYPDTIQMYQPQEERVQAIEPSSKLVSIDDLSPDEREGDEIVGDETDPAIEMEPNLELEKEVAAEESPDDLWAVDEEIEEGDETPQESEGISDVNNLDYDKLVVHLKEHLGPFIENIIKDICTQNVEKVAWEVIPDLAENLIKKELKEISSNVE